MIIFPAIDIKDGVCVRLKKGDYRQITTYENTPIDQATTYFKNGFNNIHIIDIDGALRGRAVNSFIIKEIVKKIKSKIQIGGGIRTIDDISRWVEMGVDKVVMGTAAVENIELVQTAERIAEEKGIEKELVFQAIEKAISVADGIAHPLSVLLVSRFIII